MEVHLSPELQAKVEQAAAENKSGAEEYVKQLVEHYVDHDAWFRQQDERLGAARPRGVPDPRRSRRPYRSNVSQVDAASLVTRRR